MNISIHLVTGMKFLKRFVHWVPAAVWMGAIFYFSSLPDPIPGVEPSPWKEMLGRTAHFLEYAGLAFWLAFGMAEGKISELDLSPGRMILLISLAMAYALSDEVHQIFVPGRGFQVLDVFIDTAGAGVSMGVVGWWIGRGRLGEGESL